VRLARSSAASFIVESSGTDAEQRSSGSSTSPYDALLPSQGHVVEARADELALTRRSQVWATRLAGTGSPLDLRRSLPGHAVPCRDDRRTAGQHAYLLHTDLLRFAAPVDRATSAAGRQRARLLRLSPVT